MKILFAFAFFFLPFFFFGQESVSFYFENNKSALNQVELVKLNKWIAANKTSKILSITGSTDEVGSTGYNDTLSQKRVDYIFNKVKASVKIREDFKSISLGEAGAKSNTKAENRKAIVVFLQEKDLAKEAELIKPKIEEPKDIPTNGLTPIEEVDMHFPEGASLAEKIELSRPGTLIVLPEIQFYKNSFGIMPSSQREVFELIRIMTENPRLHIEIQGHICCTDNDVRKLSLERAKQVRRVLQSNYILERRVKVKGFGVTKPKFPIPEATEEQAAANRRVEIMILEK
ncbi:OmpA family protein [Flavobacterium sp. F372]|jgi:outer membrane protein OmpA-like peptidoglycan-associated protein|uniref:OmpA family protein n=1 Tax=Flavobacterium bernardetii TaxID=2813823 RepID=A0ABR7IWZ2_9FLAO|nr:OmpA family protein [Flavobacterium bernardetii]MBC5834294.1 OmpA family protein [Flavobacterium bernardetii]NHF70067.1 OmpA family protein [Flavobacterium bernardetii]